MKTALTSLAILLTLAAGTAQAQTPAERQAVAQLLQQNAKVETQIAHDLSHGRLGVVQGEFVEGNQPGLFAVETVVRPAKVETRPQTAAAHKRVVLVFEDLSVARHQAAASRADAMHESVEALRDAEQQRAIARGLVEGRLDMHQVTALEETQLRLAREQYEMTRHGHESVAQALRVSHQQDLQDWAIASANPALL